MPISWKVWVRFFQHGKVGPWREADEQPPNGFGSESEARKWLHSQRKHLGEACSTMVTAVQEKRPGE